MDLARRLDREFRSSGYSGRKYPELTMDDCMAIAEDYAILENCISVLSNVSKCRSHIYYGRFAKTLGLGKEGGHDTVDSIWEETVLNLIHPDDLNEKYTNELKFFRLMKGIPEHKRAEYCLMDRIRMRNSTGEYMDVLHRMYYAVADNMWLALCLYGPLFFELPQRGAACNMATGEIIELGSRTDIRILSDREIQVLRLIDQGMMSKSIADHLCISINTVNRHRQEILRKLQARNSIEACRIARTAEIL